MTSTKEADTILSGQHLPLDIRSPSHAHQDEARVASMVCGVIAARQIDEVICPFLLRRNLVIPARSATSPGLQLH